MVTNITACKKLIRKYRRIGYTSFRKERREYHLDANCSNLTVFAFMTGFGNKETCTLCKSIPNCGHCIYVLTTGHTCTKDVNAETYKNILYSTLIKDFISAAKTRAEHLEKLVNQYKQSKNENYT